MTSFTFIHGAWHGPWCWYKIENLLKSAGHNVNLVNLNNITNPTIELYVKYVDDFISSFDEDQIIIGHSMAGVILSQLNNSKIEKLVYLSAFLLEKGQKISDIINKYPSEHLKLEFDKNFKYCKVIEDYIDDLFYNKSNSKDIEYAKSRLVPQSYKIFNQVINQNRFQNFKKYYIRCLYDNAINIKAQNVMITGKNLDGVYTLLSDHSPFFSDVKNLYKIVLDISLKHDNV